ncbi:MAG: tRNA glutamyl-Q(34) synthetase GluQRS [Clostridia bacterium]|nr:tRNA glutamyl-Q(34) synthetase GluQRS [Clostridia bacterium]
MVTGRFAPTPSGRLHLGNMLCAMLAWLSVRSQNGRFLLRIEDVDRPRCPDRLAEQCIRDLQWLGFDWDEAPVYQHERTAAYEEALQRLTAAGLTYPCFCTRAELHPEQAPNLGDTQAVYPGTCARLTPAEIALRSRQRSPAIRLRVPDRTVAFTDRLQGRVEENLARDCGDFVLRRSDGLFGYQLAVVADDAASGVNEVVRGRDILSATPRQIYLLELLGHPAPAYVHIPLLTDPLGRRLAKRDRDLDLDALARRMGPREIIGLLACACGLRDRVAPASLEELVPDFSWARIPAEDLRLPAF